MGRRKRSTLPKKPARGKPKGQPPPKPLSDKPSGGAGGKKRKRTEGSSNPQMKSTKPDKKATTKKQGPGVSFFFDFFCYVFVEYMDHDFFIVIN